jgi:hypothetical protein
MLSGVLVANCIGLVAFRGLLPDVDNKDDCYEKS